MIKYRPAALAQLVQYLTPNPKFEGSNADATGIKKKWHNIIR